MFFLTWWRIGQKSKWCQSDMLLDFLFWGKNIWSQSDMVMDWSKAIWCRGDMVMAWTFQAFLTNGMIYGVKIMPDTPWIIR